MWNCVLKNEEVFFNLKWWNLQYQERKARSGKSKAGKGKGKGKVLSAAEMGELWGWGRIRSMAAVWAVRNSPTTARLSNWMVPSLPRSSSAHNPLLVLLWQFRDIAGESIISCHTKRLLMQSFLLIQCDTIVSFLSRIVSRHLHTCQHRKPLDLYTLQIP